MLMHQSHQNVTCFNDPSLNSLKTVPYRVKSELKVLNDANTKQ